MTTSIRNILVVSMMLITMAFGLAQCYSHGQNTNHYITVRGTVIR